MINILLNLLLQFSIRAKHLGKWLKHQIFIVRDHYFSKDKDVEFWSSLLF